MQHPVCWTVSAGLPALLAVLLYSLPTSRRHDRKLPAIAVATATIGAALNNPQLITNPAATALGLIALHTTAATLTAHIACATNYQHVLPHITKLIEAHAAVTILAWHTHTIDTIAQPLTATLTIAGLAWATRQLWHLHQIHITPPQQTVAYLTGITLWIAATATQLTNPITGDGNHNTTTFQTLALIALTYAASRKPTPQPVRLRQG